MAKSGGTATYVRPTKAKQETEHQQKSDREWLERRAFLGTVTGIVASIAGCASGDGPASGTTQMTTTTTATSTTSPYRRRFVEYLSEKEVDVQTVEADPPASTVLLRYVTEKATADDLGGEIGTIAGGFYREVQVGWEMDRLDATVLDSDETPLATWHALTKWLIEFQEGERTAEELSLRILKTIELAG